MGKGHFAHGFNPPPANFQDPGTIAMLQEAFLFWRISKGGPGLPKESTPWNSVMPAWEDRLTEDQIWQVIMYLYDATGQQPRRWETRALRAAVLAATIVALVGAAPALVGAQAGDAKAGKAVYELKCVGCHGEKGDGKGPAAELLVPAAARLHLGHLQDPDDGRARRRPTRTSSRSSPTGCPGRRCRRGRCFPRRTAGISSRTSRRSRRTSSRKRPRSSSCPRKSRRRRSPSSAARRCSRRSSATSATAPTGGPTARRAPS